MIFKKIPIEATIFYTNGFKYEGTIDSRSKTPRGKGKHIPTQKSQTMPHNQIRIEGQTRSRDDYYEYVGNFVNGMLTGYGVRILLSNKENYNDIVKSEGIYSFGKTVGRIKHYVFPCALKLNHHDHYVEDDSIFIESYKILFHNKITKSKYERHASGCEYVVCYGVRLASISTNLTTSGIIFSRLICKDGVIEIRGKYNFLQYKKDGTISN